MPGKYSFQIEDNVFRILICVYYYYYYYLLLLLLYLTSPLILYLEPNVIQSNEYHAYDFKNINVSEEMLYLQVAVATWSCLRSEEGTLIELMNQRWF